MDTVSVDIGLDFCAFPQGRTAEDHEYNGHRFRTQHLVPLLRNNSGNVKILFDNTLSCSSSWLDEVFGGLVKYHGYSVETLRQRLVLCTQDRALRDEVWGYICASKPLHNFPPLMVGKCIPTEQQLAYLWQYADDSFTKEFDLSVLGPVPEVPDGWKLYKPFILQCKNVYPHVDPWTSYSDEEPDIRRAVFWYLGNEDVYFGLYGYKAIMLGPNDFVSFDDTLEHYLMADKTWVGCSWQLIEG